MPKATAKANGRPDTKAMDDLEARIQAIEVLDIENRLAAFEKHVKECQACTPPPPKQSFWKR